VPPCRSESTPVQRVALQRGNGEVVALVDQEVAQAVDGDWHVLREAAFLLRQ
jgi:hypothetical protein